MARVAKHPLGSIATVHNALVGIRVRDTCGVEIDAGEDQALLLAAVVASSRSPSRRIR